MKVHKRSKNTVSGDKIRHFLSYICIENGLRVEVYLKIICRYIEKHSFRSKNAIFMFIADFDSNSLHLCHRWVRKNLSRSVFNDHSSTKRRVYIYSRGKSNYILFLEFLVFFHFLKTRYVINS